MWRYCPAPPSVSRYAPWWVLYGGRFLAKRRSLYGRNRWNDPSSARSAHRAAIGAFTHVSNVALLACQKTFVLSASRPS